VIEVELRDADGASIYRSDSARWSLTGSWLSVGSSNEHGTGPFFTVYLPLSLRAFPKAGEITSYVGEGMLGSASTWGGAAAREGGGDYDISKVVAVSRVQSPKFNLVVDVTLGAAHLDTFQGGRPKFPVGTTFIIDVVVPFESYADFSDTRKTREGWSYFSKKLKDDFDYDLAPWESVD
jgi:hypothetical protein